MHIDIVVLIVMHDTNECSVCEVEKEACMQLGGWRGGGGGGLVVSL